MRETEELVFSLSTSFLGGILNAYNMQTLPPLNSISLTYLWLGTHIISMVLMIRTKLNTKSVITSIFSKRKQVKHRIRF